MKIEMNNKIISQLIIMNNIYTQATDDEDVDSEEEESL